MGGSLNPHKNRQGYPCYGRYGVYVRTKWAGAASTVKASVQFEDEFLTEY